MAAILRALIGLLVCCAALLPRPALALEAIKVDENVYAIVGELGQRSAVNRANNATFGVVVTRDGVVLIDAGGTARGAAELEAAIARITDQKVVVVINTGGQDHRWLGNSYWRARGARVIASQAAVADQKSRFDMQWMGLQQLVGQDVLAGTQASYATEVFDRTLELNVGGEMFALRHPGRAHTPGDSFVWMAARRIVFAGDIVFANRMLGILPAPLSSSADWIKSFDILAALDPAIVIPGHGRPTTLAKAKADTRDYLAFLQESVKQVLERKGDMVAASRIDQAPFMHLEGADQLAGRNAQAVFEELEFD